jgi:hypothetical protein
VLEGLAEGVAALTKQFAELSASVEDLKKKGLREVVWVNFASKPG